MSCVQSSLGFACPGNGIERWIDVAERYGSGWVNIGIRANALVCADVCDDFDIFMASR